MPMTAPSGWHIIGHSDVKLFDPAAGNARAAEAGRHNKVRNSEHRSMIEILTTGLPNTVQDLGRPGQLALGISHGGAMDKEALATANMMVGNAATAAGVEVALHPFRLRAHIDTTIAVTGADCRIMIDDRPYPAWWAIPIRAGQTLTIDPPRAGARSYIAFAGGIDVPVVIGSRATDVKGGFGGLSGHGLSRGDRLPLCPAHCPLPPGGFGASADHRRGGIGRRRGLAGAASG
jgi:hypothetical protein